MPIHVPITGTLVLMPAMSQVPPCVGTGALVHMLAVTHSCAVEVWVHPVRQASRISVLPCFSTGSPVSMSAIFQGHSMGWGGCSRVRSQAVSQHPHTAPKLVCLHSCPVSLLPCDDQSILSACPSCSFAVTCWPGRVCQIVTALLCLPHITDARSRPGEACSPAVPRGCQGMAVRPVSKHAMT